MTINWRVVARIIVITLVVAIAMWATTGCLSPDYTGNPAGPKVSIWGDSITKLSEQAIRLHPQLEETYNIDVSAESGYTSTQIVDSVGLHPATEPDLVVVNVGSNDWQTLNVGASLDNLAAVRSYFQEDCFVAVTLNQHTASPEFNEWAGWYNFWLIFGGQYPVIADWDAAIQAHPGILTDTLHPNQMGQQVYAQLIADTLEASCP